jgi:hypothetical protein
MLVIPLIIDGHRKAEICLTDQREYNGVRILPVAGEDLTPEQIFEIQNEFSNVRYKFGDMIEYEQLTYEFKS